MRNLSITILSEKDGGALSRMLTSNSQQYQQYFYPFPFDVHSIAVMLKNVKQDKYWGVWENDKLIAFFMLRGFDEGYEIPAYGACVAESHQGKGLLKLSLHFVFSWCRIFSISKLMLKVHPENYVAKKTYEAFGFKSGGVDSRNNNLIYYYTFSG